MTSRNDQLWELISTHPMPADATGLSFAEQLIREHGIKRATALTAIEEYRKFLYLCATREDRNVPSKAVDLVWHLHMQHSRDYWDGLCKKIGKPIHHAPGGEGSAHLDDYKATVKAYEQRFGTPPKGIWRQNSRLGHAFGALLSGGICLAVLVKFGTAAASLAVMVLFVAMPFLVFFNSVRALTTRGQYTLTFETGDPFADSDAGDCGSGCGGGCGD